MSKSALICGAGGFIGSHIAKWLKNEGYHVAGIDLKYPEFSNTSCDYFIIGDLRNKILQHESLGQYDIIIQLAADMGGAGWIFTGDNDADIMHNSSIINLNVLEALQKVNYKGIIFYSSSACIYPQELQNAPWNRGLREDEAYPVNCDSEYGYEKIFSERLYDAYRRNYGLNIRVARFHNIFGKESCYNNGREKYPAAICRKVAEAKDGGSITIWGDGKATRSFLYIDECCEGIMRLINSEYYQPINIGSNELISVEDLAKMVIDISGKKLSIEYDLSKPQGVRGRNSNNDLIYTTLNWEPERPLREGIEKLYSWINNFY